MGGSPATKAAKMPLFYSGDDSFSGNAMIENRNGLVVCTEVVLANGTAERDAAMMMAERLPGNGRVTLAGDRGYDTRDFVGEMRGMNITPHVAQNTSGRRSAIDGRTTRHIGYEISQQKWKRIEEVFGWLKTVAGLRQARHRGLEKVAWMFTFAAAAYNLVRMRNLRIQALAAEAEVSGKRRSPAFFSTGQTAYSIRKPPNRH